MEKAVHLLFALLLLAGCTDEITYKAGYPGIKLPEGDHNLLIIHRIDSTDKIKSSKKNDQLLHMAYGIFSQQLLESLSESGIFPSVRDSTVNFQVDHEALERPIPRAQLGEILSTNGFDLLLVMEHFDLYKNKTFSMSSDDANTQSTYLNTSSVFTLYNTDGNTIDRQNLSTSRVIDDGEFDGLLELSLSPAMKHFEDLIKDMSEQLGSSYIHAFSPRTFKVTRTIYLGKKYKGLDEMILKGEYEKAEAMIMPYMESKDWTTLFRAASNMRILREAEGKGAEAEEWKKKADFYIDQVLTDRP